MKALIISLESFQRGEVPEEVKKYVLAHHGNIFTILDESSKIKTNEPCKESKKSKRTQAVMKLNRIGHRCILTGTFMSKSPVNAYDQMNFLSDGFFSESIFAFAEHYTVRRNLVGVRGARTLLSEKDYTTIRKRLQRCKDEMSFINTAEGIKSFYGIGLDDCRHIAEHEEYFPFKNLGEMWKRIGDNVMKLSREDVSNDLPPKQYKTLYTELTAEQKKLYLALQNQHCTDNLTVDNGLQLYLRFQDICNGYEPIETEELNENGKPKVMLKPLAENPKIDMLEEAIDDIGDKQVVIWCSRSKLLYDAKNRMEELGYTCGVYDGINKNREADYEAFANKKIQLIFCNQASAGYGLDRMKEADYAIYLCNSYSVEHRQQSENRIYRGNITRSKYIIDICVKGTCESRVTQALLLGKELLDKGKTDTSLFTLEE